MTIPPKEVNISENAKSFLGENLSARTPPKIYDKNAEKCTIARLL